MKKSLKKIEKRIKQIAKEIKNLEKESDSLWGDRYDIIKDKIEKKALKNVKRKEEVMDHGDNEYTYLSYTYRGETQYYKKDTEFDIYDFGTFIDELDKAIHG